MGDKGNSVAVPVTADNDDKTFQSRNGDSAFDDIMVDHHNTRRLQTAAFDEMMNKDLNVMSAADGLKLHEQEIAAGKWTKSMNFQCAVCVFIVGNAMVLGAEVDHGDEWHKTFFAFRHLFTSVFLVEMLCRWYVEGLRSYFSETNSQFDFVLVVLGVIDVWILSPIANAQGFRMLTVLRIVRLVRLIRVIRIFRLFKELAVIGASFAAGGKTLFFGAVFVLIVVYVFGIIAVERFGRATEGDCDAAARLLKPKHTLVHGGSSGDYDNQDSGTGCRDLYDFGTLGSQYSLFGTLDRAMLTLYTCVTDGCGQDIVYKMVYKTPSAIVYWSFFVFFTSIGLVNVLIGLFCENVFAQAQRNEKALGQLNRERRRVCLSKLKTLFLEMDTDASNTISRAEFMNALENNEIVERTLEELELDEHTRLFDVLDADGTGSLDVEEFFNGTLLLANADEPAKTKDTIQTYLLAQTISKRVYLLSELVKELVGRSSERDVQSNGSLKDQPAVSSDWVRQQFATMNERQSNLECQIKTMQSRFEYEFQMMRESINALCARQTGQDDLVEI